MSPGEERDLTTAEAYDAEAEATGWLGPEVAFGMVYEHIQPGQSILDIGIGTGLGSILFRKAGLTVHGMDISPDMLDACRTKGFDRLTRHDLAELPYPMAQKTSITSSASAYSTSTVICPRCSPRPRASSSRAGSS